MSLNELKLPAFAFVEGYMPDDELQGRIVILHTRSASVIEIFDRNNAFLLEGVLTYRFSYVNRFGVKEPMVAALRYCTTLDKDADFDMIIKEIMKPAAEWYCGYCTWEDENIVREGTK